MKRTAIFLLCFSVGGRYHADAFVFGVFAGQNPRCQATSKLRSRVHNDADFDADDNIIERRAFFQSIVAAVAVTAGTISSSAVSQHLQPTISDQLSGIVGRSQRCPARSQGTRMILREQEKIQASSVAFPTARTLVKILLDPTASHARRKNAFPIVRMSVARRMSNARLRLCLAYKYIKARSYCCTPMII